MKNFYYKIISNFPSKNGKKALEELMYVLAHGGININIQTVDDASGVYFVAKSTNLPQKYIITSALTLAELDRNIRDAIFSAFQVPNYYCDDRLLNIPALSKNIDLKYAVN
ncbi:MAG: hypothetical protein V1770_02415 [bacterium]